MTNNSGIHFNFKIHIFQNAYIVKYQFIHEKESHYFLSLRTVTQIEWQPKLVNILAYKYWFLRLTPSILWYDYLLHANQQLDLVHHHFEIEKK
jgi:hypothetical protein